MENSPTFCELDYKITSSEIMKAISKLKSGKAVGLDNLPNELLKSDVPFLYQYYRNFSILYLHQGYILVNGPQHIYVLYLNQVIHQNLKTIEALKITRVLGSYLILF